LSSGPSEGLSSWEAEYQSFLNSQQQPRKYATKTKHAIKDSNKIFLLIQAVLKLDFVKKQNKINKK